MPLTKHNRSAVCLLALAGLVAAASTQTTSAQTNVDIPVVRVQQTISFTGWGDIEPDEVDDTLSFTGWGDIEPDQIEGTLTFTGWGGGTPPPVTLTFEGWNRNARPSEAILKFTGLAQPPPCSLDDLEEKMIPPRVGENGHLYQMFYCKVDWHTAASLCESVGANLVTINSQAEQDLIASMAGICGNCWLGATDTDSEGNFAWLTGEPFGYTNWAAGEPNETCGGEDFLHMQLNGYWNDQQADGGCNGWGPMGYYCEWVPE